MSKDPAERARRSMDYKSSCDGLGERGGRGTPGEAAQIGAMPPATKSSMPLMKLRSSEAGKTTGLEG